MDISCPDLTSGWAWPRGPSNSEPQKDPIQRFGSEQCDISRLGCNMVYGWAPAYIVKR